MTQETAEALGKLVFTRQTADKRSTLLILAIGLLLLAAGAGLYYYGPGRSEGEPANEPRGRSGMESELAKTAADCSFIGGIGCGVVGLLLATLGVANLASGPTYVFFHERGARRSTKAGQLVFKYDEAEAVTYGLLITALFRTWILTIFPPNSGDALDVSTPDPGSGKPDSTQATIEQVQFLRDQVVGAIARRMADQLGRGEPVRWTDKLAITREGIDAGGTLLPWDQIERSEADQSRGIFRLFVRGQDKPAATEKMTAKNFLPGWEVFRSLVQT